MLDPTGKPYRRRSTTGYFFKLADCTISWTSHAQKSIALSSTEAEYMAMSDCSRQAVWLQNFFGEIGFSIGPVPINGDNQGSIFIASNPTTNRLSKHIDVRYHYIRQVVTEGKVNLYYVRSDENPADILTKPLGRVKFAKFRPWLGLE
jgi:hypothetical protein